MKRRLMGHCRIVCMRIRLANKFPNVSGRAQEDNPSKGSYPRYSRRSTHSWTPSSDFLTSSILIEGLRVIFVDCESLGLTQVSVILLPSLRAERRQPATVSAFPQTIYA